MEVDSSSKIFLGVHFVLYGFNSIDENEVRFKLVSGGGVDAGLYTQSCTHVIVEKLIYDDVVCVAARNDGKTLVTGLWVNHSYDLGVAVNAFSILYRPVVDLNGILGAERLTICLTGYQRQDRDDVMTMVSLMGAKFSKPLIAHKVTHLICYKFEGEKYELAKRLKTIKLVNHRWLEDCLKNWALLPEANYNTSGYDLENIELEAKDSEEECDNNIEKHIGVRSSKSPITLLPSSTFDGHLSASVSVTSNILPVSTILENPKNIDVGKNSVLVPVNNKKCELPRNSSDFDISCSELAHIHLRTPISKKISDDIVSPFLNVNTEAQSDSRSYSRRNPRKSELLLSVRKLNNSLDSPIPFSASKVNHSFESPLFMVEQKQENNGSGLAQTLEKGAAVTEEVLIKGLPQRRTSDLSNYSLKSLSNSVNAELVRVKIASPSLENPKNIDVGKNAILVPVDDKKCELPRSSDFNLSCSDLAYVHVTTPLSKEISDDIVSPSLNVNAEAQSGSRSYSRRNSRKSTRLHSVGRLNNLLDSPPPFSGSKVNCSFESPLFMVKPKQENNNRSGCAQTLEKGVLVNGLPQKKTSDLSNYSLQSLSNPVNAELVRVKIAAPSLENDAPSKLDSFDRSLPQNSSCRSLVATSVCLPENSFTIDLPSSRTCTNLDVNVDRISQRSLQILDQVVSKYEDTENQQQDLKETSSDKSVKAGKLKDVGINFLRPENNSLHKSPRKKSFFKKSLGSRPKIGLTVNQKGSIHLRQEDSLSNDESLSEEGNPKKFINAAGDLSTQTGNKKLLNDTVTKEVNQHNIESVDDETEAPDNTEDLELEKTAEKRELKLQHQSNNFQVSMLARTHASEPIVGEAKLGKLVCDRNAVLNETKIKRDVNRKVSPRKKRPASKTKVRHLSSTNRKESMDGEVIQNANTEEVKEKPLALAKLKAKTCSTLPANMSGNSIEVEKENRPVIDANQNVGPVEKFSEKPTLKCNANSRKTKKTSAETNTVPVGATEEGILTEIKNEPVCFILSGHRLQRKMFQQTIRLLKGKFCRDSHQWSYQATHLIIPDPIRRTEKFFAATASGRWVLTPDYLTASKQAGRFLEEEPYEWYKNGLSEDGAINLQAPRKWRHLRERTGHGAFHGMKIIIYGECIAPPLDTLKRAVRAGDGTILATSPPYTRFLTSEVDFAIISPGMPRVDIWVQEFLKHEIPCVVADYLVEYVCKPGYPLEKHALFNTQPWAEKSFINLQNKAEEVTKVSVSANNFSDSDIACWVCRSCDRGEVMLICGDESGSTGCGVGMHIDCCDPPLQDVPEDDWFCPECDSKYRKKINSPKKRKRQANSSKMEKFM